MITLNKKKIRLFTHRIVWALYYKEWPSDQIDHINGRVEITELKILGLYHTKETKEIGLGP
jgi:hypothetical protein